MAKTYPVGIVGEQHYREAVARCRAGQPVVLYREPRNPFDAGAIAVTSAAGELIGYIPKDSFLYDHINTDGGGADAVIRSADPGSGGFRQIVLDVTLNDDGLDVLSTRGFAAGADDDDEDPPKSGDVAPWKVAVVFLLILIVLVRCSAP